MIINAKTIIVTLTLIALASYFGLRAIRAFALSIAQENHDAVAAMDAKEELDRVKKLRSVLFCHDSKSCFAAVRVNFHTSLLIPIVSPSTPFIDSHCFSLPETLILLWL